MKQKAKAGNVIGFCVLCDSLKEVIRTGWQNWNVQSDRIESVAEHIYGAQMVAIAMCSEFQYDVDLHKVILMLAVHEVGETVIGDITPYQMDADAKLKLEHKAIHTILSELKMGKELEELLIEFDAHETAESKFAYMCDKLECDIQCKLYGQRGCVDLTKQPDNISMRSSEMQELIKSGMSWEEIWLKRDREKCSFDANFLSVLDYLLTEDNILPYDIPIDRL